MRERGEGGRGGGEGGNTLIIQLLSSAFDSYRECSEIHIDICSKTNSVDQVISIAHCPSFTIEEAHGCLCLPACCMHSADTHKWLCRNHILESIANCVRAHKERGEADSSQITLLQ